MRALRWLLPLVLLAGVSHADNRAARMTPVASRAQVSTLIAGHVVVPSAPADVYATVTRYELWPYIFPEVKTVRVLYQRGPKAIVQVTSWSGKRQTLEVMTDDAQRMIRIKERGDRSGIEAGIRFRAGATAATTHATAHLTAADAPVPPARHQRASADLASIRTYFAGLPGA